VKSRLLELRVLANAPGTASSCTVKGSPLPTADVTAVAVAQTMAVAARCLRVLDVMVDAPLDVLSFPADEHGRFAALT
jgi:hypothetical protein